MVKRLAILGLVLVALSAPAAGQSPRITPAGDPSVKADTVYRLAVDPTDHPGEDFVYLLDTARGQLSAKSADRFEIGDRVHVHVSTDRGHFFGGDGERITGAMPQVPAADFGGVVDVA